jgi:translocation and assembly module TamA
VLARVEAGHIFTGQFRQLPPTLRFFAGGDQSVRGFGYETLGSRDSLNNVIGGSSLIVGSVEAEWRFLPRFAIAVFTDAGNAFTGFPLSLEQGAGLGLRWLSPVGLIRVDGAFAVSRPGAPFRLHVGIGPDL